jgi:hypothetical protein
MMAMGATGKERRKYRRVSIDFPVSYKIHGTTVLGRAMDACNEGMKVESYIPLKTALRMLTTLRKKRKVRLHLEFTYKRTYRTQGEIRHFHLDFSGNEPCRSVLGFFVPKIA